MKRSVAEYTGIGLGYILGLFTFIGSFMRRARLFHPCGHLYGAHVQTLSSEWNFPHHALVRLSEGLWKKDRWPEVLGFALRFSGEEIHSPLAHADDQDLLFATFKHVWQLPLSPFMSRYHFNQNTYFAIAPFRYQNKTFVLRLKPEWHQHESRDRFLEVDKALIKGEAAALIQASLYGQENWKNIARVTLRRQSHLDGEELAFNPFQNGMQLFPVGFIQHLRIGAYGLSQLGRRSGKKKIPGRENVLPSSPPSHSP